MTAHATTRTNLHFIPTVNGASLKPNKQQQIVVEHVGKVANKTNLPLKKRFCGMFEEDMCNRQKDEDTINRCGVKQEHGKERNAKILPGVIRHTSCPDSYLAFYFKYE